MIRASNFVELEKRVRLRFHALGPFAYSPLRRKEKEIFVAVDD